MSRGSNCGLPWSEREKDIVRDNWLTSSTAEISQMLQGNRRSRNAVIGQAHRLGLPLKESHTNFDGTPSKWPARDPEMLALRANGYSIRTIAKKMGISYGAVHGRIRSLNWKSRDAGIKISGRSSHSVHASIPTLAPRPALAPPQPVMHTLELLQSLAPIGGRMEPSQMLSEPALVVSKPPASTHSCQWPIGDPKEPDFRFCDEPARFGRPYCRSHHRLAHVHKTGERENKIEFAP